MTFTACDEGFLRTTPRVYEVKLSRLWYEITCATKAWIERSGSISALKRKSAEAGLEPGSGLAAISNYTQFIARHPDMPRAHRDRFLGQIIRCCEELRATATELGAARTRKGQPLDNPLATPSTEPDWPAAPAT